MQRFLQTWGLGADNSLTPHPQSPPNTGREPGPENKGEGDKGGVLSSDNLVAFFKYLNKWSMETHHVNSY